MSSINRLSDTPINKLSDSCFDSQSIEHLTSAPVPSKSGQKRKMAVERELKAKAGREAKKRKTSKVQYIMKPLLKLCMQYPPVPDFDLNKISSGDRAGHCMHST